METKIDPITGTKPLVLAITPIPELQNFYDICFAVWELLDTYYRWDENDSEQERPLFNITPEERQSFILEQFKADNRNSITVWNIWKRINENDEAVESWVDDKLSRINNAIKTQDTEATIQNICALTRGKDREKLFTHLFHRLITNQITRAAIDDAYQKSGIDISNRNDTSEISMNAQKVLAAMEIGISIAEQQIQGKTGLSRTTVQRCLQELKNLGFVELVNGKTETGAIKNLWVKIKQL